jgi:hypothetical protein
MNTMNIPNEPGQSPLSQELESYDVFGQTVRQRIEALAGSIDELNEKSDILEYEWVFSRDDWHLYQGGKYDRCRLVSISKDNEGSYTVVAAKAWSEDKDLLTEGTLSPTQYVRYVSPKVQLAHFSQASSRLLDEAMGEWSARFRTGDVPYDVDPYEYLYESAFGRLWQKSVQLPEVHIYDEYLARTGSYFDYDILNQAVTTKTLRLGTVREAAWEWGPFRDDPEPEAYSIAIQAVQQRTDIPDLSDYQPGHNSYGRLLSNIKYELSELWNKRNNIDDEFFFSPGILDPEMAGLYQTRFEAVIKEVEQDFRDLGYDPDIYRNAVFKYARVRIYSREHENERKTRVGSVNWSDQTTIQALKHVLDNAGSDLVDCAIDNALFTKAMYGEMPPVIQPMFQKMAQIGMRDTVRTSDKVIVAEYVVLPKRLTVSTGGEITHQQPNTMREWVESINEWSREPGDPFDYLYYIHKKPDGTVLYAELRIQPQDEVKDVNEYAGAHSAKVLLANFYPTAITYLQKYHARQTLLATDYHGAIHIKQFGDNPLNDGINKKIEFVHNA